MSTPKTILFLGATGGCGFSTLRRSLAAGHTCVALCRTPSKLTDKLPEPERRNLRVEQGNAVDPATLLRHLAKPSDPTALVDAVVFTVGGAFQFSKMNNDDPTVCERAMDALLGALRTARAERGLAGAPRIVAVSTTGLSEHGRDYPLALFPLYHYMLAEPHKDKKKMEAALLASGEAWTVVRPSLLTDAAEEEEGKEQRTKAKPVREGMEDPSAHALESKAVGYTITREDVGRWMFENVVDEQSDKWVRKIASITY